MDTRPQGPAADGQGLALPVGSGRAVVEHRVRQLRLLLSGRRFIGGTGGGRRAGECGNSQRQSACYADRCLHRGTSRHPGCHAERR